MKTTILSLAVVFAISIGANAQTLDDQFQDLKRNSYTYKEYKNIKLNELNDFWSVVQDSLKRKDQSYATAQGTIEAQNNKINELNSTIDTQKSAIEERKLAKRLGGHVQPRSGGVAWSRYDKTTACGDVTTPDLHIEHKRLEPTTKSIGVKRQWLAKVTEGAKRKMKTPAMAFHFAGAQGYAEDWVMLPLDVVERLLAASKEDE